MGRRNTRVWYYWRQNQKNQNKTLTQQQQRKAFCEKNTRLEIDYSGNEIKCLGSAENMKNYNPTTHEPLETTGRQFRRGKALLKWGHNMREAQGFNEV
jgi:molybdenum cofactor biosynthesis enzyme MoaA